MHAWVEFACPLVNPPAQRHLYENKRHNLRLAIARIGQLKLDPGAGFSFWHAIGPPTAEQGFREGAMFVQREVRTAIGGGLCQLSGLLYNLALLSGCAILERHPHSIDAYGAARYLPLGRDATVAFGLKDLRFANPHPLSIELHLELGEAHTAGRVFAAQPPLEAIDIRCDTEQEIPSPEVVEIDPELQAGEERVDPGCRGSVVLAWRERRRPGEAAQCEFLSRDHYAATPTRVRRGTRA